MASCADKSNCHHHIKQLEYAMLDGTKVEQTHAPGISF